MAVKYVHGYTVPEPYTPEAAVAAGDVVVVGDECRIAHLDIAAGALGSLHLPSGTAIYTAPKSTGSGHALADGATVYWDDENSVATYTSNSSANKVIGETVGSFADGAEYVRFRHSKGN